MNRHLRVLASLGCLWMRVLSKGVHSLMDATYSVKSSAKGHRKRMSNKSYVDNPVFITAPRASSGILIALMAVQTPGRQVNAKDAWREELWDCHGHGDDSETFGDGKKRPLPCCSMPTQANCFPSPATRHPRPVPASGCFAVHLPYPEAQCLSSSKFGVSRCGKCGVTLNLLCPRPRS